MHLSITPDPGYSAKRFELTFRVTTTDGGFYSRLVTVDAPSRLSAIVEARAHLKANGADSVRLLSWSVSAIPA